MIGLEKGTVRLEKHDPEWEAEARRTIDKLKEILGGGARDIQHVGSTAVRSIMAKPIIDIAVAANSYGCVLRHAKELERAGFYYLPEDSKDMDQLFFAAGSYYAGTGDLQTHFVHVVPHGSMQWINYINFRDYLNATPEAAKEYEALKLSLAAASAQGGGREEYLREKHDFIEYTLRKALVYSYLGKDVHIVMDRPIGTEHPKHPGLIYPINYGYIPGVFGGDGEELDVYLLGVDTPVTEYDARIIGIVHRLNDVEDKLVAAPENMKFTKEEAEGAVRFQEEYYDSYVEIAKNL